MKHARSIVIALLSGTGSGFLFGGIGSRIAMRLVAESLGRYPVLTSDTMFVLLIGTVLGSAGGVIFWLVRQLVPTSTRLQVLALTATLFALVSVPLFLRPPNPGDELALNPNLGRVLFSILFVAYGSAVPLVARVLDSYLPAGERYRTLMAIVTFVLGLPGILGVGMIVSMVVGQ